jgi:uroporphyrinogen-III synthase
MERPIPEFLMDLTLKCASVVKVPVYQWALPEDLAPLEECVQGIARGAYDVLLFMTAVQVIHLFQVAERMQRVAEMRAGLLSMVIISIGPTTTEELTHYGITPDFEPSRPKMSFIVNEAAQYAGKVLEQKRGGEALMASAHFRIQSLRLRTSHRQVIIKIQVDKPCRE